MIIKVNDNGTIKSAQVVTTNDVIQTLTSGTAIGSVGGKTLYAPSGGGGIQKFTITVTGTTSGSETTYTADKTFTEIVAAYNSGDILEVVISGTGSVLSLANADTSEYGTFTFSNYEIGDSWASSEEIYIDYEDNTSYYYASFTEKDPMVPAWAKQSTKPTYTASEVGALPSSTVIPSKTSDLTNDSGFLTSAGAVTSFNGNTGAVTYTAPVTSVNGQTGAVTGLQTTSNLVTSLSASSTDAQYPSAKLFYDTVGDIESLLASI